MAQLIELAHNEVTYMKSYTMEPQFQHFPSNDIDLYKLAQFADQKDMFLVKNKTKKNLQSTQRQWKYIDTVGSQHLTKDLAKQREPHAVHVARKTILPRYVKVNRFTPSQILDMGQSHPPYTNMICRR